MPGTPLTTPNRPLRVWIERVNHPELDNGLFGRHIDNGITLAKQIDVLQVRAIGALHHVFCQLQQFHRGPISCGRVAVSEPVKNSIAVMGEFSSSESGWILLAL